MKKLFFVIALSGCATGPQQPTQQQIAVLSYYADLCQKQGVNVNDPAVLRGCILANYRRDMAATPRPNIFEALGSVYSRPPQTNCTTRPDYAGGFVTQCH